jgi:anti-sigma factor RsiW
MMSDPWTARLSDYLDGELSEGERSALERHLAACPTCTSTLEDLTRVAQRARRLPTPAPGTDLWPGIAARIGADTRPLPIAQPTRRHWSFSLPQLAAACLAVAALSGSGVWFLAGRSPAASSATPAIPSRPVALAPSPALSRPALAEQKYDAAVAELEQVLQQGRGTLDTTTVHILERNLALIDRAIADARRALAADPHNAYLNAHLAGTMRRKIDLLRQAAAIVAARS